MTNVLDLYNSFKGGMGGFKGSKLIYPLENQSDYLGKITFTPVIEDPLDLGSTSSGVLNNIRNAGIETQNDEKGFFAAAGRTAEWLGDLAFDQTEKGEDARKNLGAKAKEVGDQITNFYKGSGTNSDIRPREPLNESLNLNTDRRIQLYLPRAIQIADTATYDNTFQLGFIGGAAETGFKGGGAIATAAKAGLALAQDTTASVLNPDSMKSMSREGASLVGARIASAIPGAGDGVSGAVQSATQVTTNPNVRALFKNVPIRNFSFQFELIPTSQAEAASVEDIIKVFREELYPTAMIAGGINVAYRYPNRFEIKVRYNNRDIKGIKFLPVYLQSFNATYNSATAGMHRDGRFSSVSIAMSFTEARALAKQDIERGGY